MILKLVFQLINILNSKTHNTIFLNETLILIASLKIIDVKRFFFQYLSCFETDEEKNSNGVGNLINRQINIC